MDTECLRASPLDLNTMLRYAVLCAFGLLGSTLASGQQPLGEAYWAKLRAKADSVLIAHFGAEFRTKHISDPDDPINYAVVGGNGVAWADLDTVSTLPTRCFFEFDILFDSKQAPRSRIEFTITPEGGRVHPSIEPLAEWNGFVKCAGACRFAYDLEGFIILAKENGLQCKRKTAVRELRWIPPDSAAWSSGERDGRYELTLGKYRGKGETRRGSSTDSYYVFDAIVFDPFTGAVLRKEQRKETYMIGCGREFL